MSWLCSDSCRRCSGRQSHLTVVRHADIEALLEATVLAFVAGFLVNATVKITVIVHQLQPDCASEETLWGQTGETITSDIDTTERLLLKVQSIRISIKLLSLRHWKYRNQSHTVVKISLKDNLNNFILFLLQWTLQKTQGIRNRKKDEMPVEFAFKRSVLSLKHKSHFSSYIFYWSIYYLIQVPVGGVAPNSNNWLTNTD